MKSAIYSICKNLVKFIYFIIFRIKVSGRENIPKTGGLILVCNHISSFDPPLVAVVIKRQLRFLAKKELFKNKLFGGLLNQVGAISLDRGNLDAAAIKKSIRALKSGEILLLFPQGTRRKELLEKDFKDGVLSMAIMADVPIVPVAIKGNYSFGKRMNISFGKLITLDEIKKSSEEKTGKTLMYERIKELYDK